MKKVLLAMLICMSSLYAEADKECLGVDFLISIPLKKADSEFDWFARARMTKIAKQFGIGVCLDYYNLSKQIQIMEMDWFDTYFQRVESVGNTDSARCYTTNKRKQLKKDIEDYVISQPKMPSKIATCLELYDSKEYQEEIERIVKKYCNNCK